MLLLLVKIKADFLDGLEYLPALLLEEKDGTDKYGSVQDAYIPDTSYSGYTGKKIGGKASRTSGVTVNGLVFLRKSTSGITLLHESLHVIHSRLGGLFNAEIYARYMVGIDAFNKIPHDDVWFEKMIMKHTGEL